MPHPHRTLLLALVCCLVTFDSSLQAEQRKQSGKQPTAPNVIFILADDLGWKDLGCYGSELFKTPHLDQLAKGGMRFTDAYAASCVCSPTRSSIMTGKYPARNDLTIWLGGRGGAPAAKRLELEETTIAEALKQQGYMTAMVGKWHLGEKSHWPRTQGFDIAIGEPHRGTPAGGYYLPNGKNLPGAKKGDYLTDRLTDEAIKIIEEHVAKVTSDPKNPKLAGKQTQPFFLYQAYHSVHTPIQGRPDLVKQHAERAKGTGRRFNASYAAMLHSLDAGVGRIMATLKKHKIERDTLVIFFSDNGGFSHSRGKKNNITDNRPLRRGKGYCYEGGHRVPFIAHWPGQVRADAACSEPITSADFYPTLLRLAGGQAKPKQHADGIDLTPLFKTPTATLGRDAIYWHYPHHSPQGGTPSGAIRAGDWKLIEFFEHGSQQHRVELFNLKDDLGETKNLADQQEAMKAKLLKKLVAWRASVDAKMPPKKTDKPGPKAGPKSSSKSAGNRANSSAGNVVMTPKVAGFDVIKNSELRKIENGYELASNASGLAMRKLDQPLTQTATFKITITPGTGSPSNGFLAMGSSPDDTAIKCGLFVGGNYAAVFENAYPSTQQTRLNLPLQGGKTVDLTVTVDIKAQTVQMSIGKSSITHRLRNKITSIRYVGYQAIRTRARFSNIATSK